MIARYFKDSNAEGPAGLNAMWDTMQQMVGTLDTSHLANPQEGAEAAAQTLDLLKTPPYEKDIETIQTALINMLREIKTGIQTQTPVTELVTRQLTQVMMENMVKGENAVPTVQTISLEQLAGAYSTLPGATPELGAQFSELIKNFIKDFIDIAQRQGLTNGIPDE